MAQPRADSNRELLERGYEAFNAGDVETVVGIMDEDVDWTSPAGAPFGGHYHGPDAVVENVFGPIMEIFEEIELHVDRWIDGGDTVVALGTARGTAANTGTDFQIPFAHVFDVTDGTITRFVEYTDTVLMRDAAGT